MIKIYGASGESFSSMTAYVQLEDYESLQAALSEALEIGTRSHYECEDCFFSCALLCCDDSRRSDKCDCGADERNERIAELRKFLDDK